MTHMELQTKPHLLRDDNFTPATRTPWGGRRIPERFRMDPTRYRNDIVGEAWEFSVEPAFPSRLAAAPDVTLADLIASDPVGWCGRREGGPSLLLKTIDAADRLSLQVHPSDNFEGLKAGECGKPEAWIILEHLPGSGIWLGLADGVGRADIEAALDAAAPLEPLLHFVPVKRGDTFIIGPGTVHAIGAGVTLLEPQLVRPLQSGLTYRFWDWGRRYDAAGRPDAEGTARPIHRAEALAVTAWGGPRGAAFEAACRSEAVALSGPVGLEGMSCLRLGPVSVERWRGAGTMELQTSGCLTVVHVVAGAATLDGLRIGLGRTLVIPASNPSTSLRFETGTDLFVLREDP